VLPPLGWTPLFPLWGLDTSALAQEFVRTGYRAILTCVDTTQLAPAFAVREFDASLLAELLASVDPRDFNFRRPVKVSRGETAFDEDCA
jgi:diphthamide synthase (EF-2-diphthine--ammonia ligase)